MTDQLDYLNLPVSRFLDDTAADQPTPGGGSVAALVTALACATGRMAASYTLGRERYAEAQAVVTKLAERLDRAQAMARELVAEDMIAFEALQAATRKGAAATTSDDERAAALAGAIGVPFEIASVAGAVLADLDRLKDVANPYLLSDIAVAAELAMAAVRAAAINVRINLPQVGQSAERDLLDQQLAREIDHAEHSYRQVRDYVDHRL